MYSKGIMWLDDCRIPFVDENINFDRPRLREKKEWVYDLGTTWENPDVKEYNQQGRFTPNLLVCDDMLNDGSVSKGGEYSEKLTINAHQNTQSKYQYSKLKKQYNPNDKGTNSRYYNLDLWFDKMLEGL